MDLIDKDSGRVTGHVDTSPHCYDEQQIREIIKKVEKQNKKSKHQNSVPKELYDELLERYEEVVRENERLKNQPDWRPCNPCQPPYWEPDWYKTTPYQPNKIWMKHDTKGYF